MTMERINSIRNEFYKVLLELFTHYKQFVSKDPYGDTTFDVKNFQKISQKQFRDFYNAFFYANTEKQDKLNNQVFLNFISKQGVAADREAQTCSIMHFNESIQRLQDGDAIAPFKRTAMFLQDETQSIKNTEPAPKVEPSQFSIVDLKDAYLMERSLNSEGVAKMFPIEETIQGEDGSRGYRYLIFPCLNEILYKN